ncbi:DUF748 domain-containing protein [soil metagenome]
MKKFSKITLVIVAILIVARLILPYVVLRYANKTLANMKGYYGHVKDIDIELIRGAYKIDSIYLNKLDTITKKQTPFFSAELIDLSIEWRAIFKGSLVGELVFEKPRLAFVKDKVEPAGLRSDSTSFKDLLGGFMPLKINRFEIKEGIIKYVDNGSKPRVDIQMTNTYILAENLRNSYDSSTLLPAKVRASSEVYDGTLTFNMKLNPLAAEPTFDMNTEAKSINLVKLNEFFQAYARVDVNKGTFGLYAEAAAKEGKFDGYVKPIIKDLDVLGKEDRKDNIFHQLYEGIVGTVADIFTNQSKDQFATKIPFKGEVKNLDPNIWYAIGEIIKNAFIQALAPAIDHEISIATIDAAPKEKKTFLQKIFGKKDEKAADEKK